MMDAYQHLLRSDLSSFIAKTLHSCDPSADYMPNWHIDLIAEYLSAAEKGEIQRLIINMPPRCLKSIAVSVAWPAWLIGRSPKRRIIAASYAASLSIKHSIDCRLVMQSQWYKDIFPKLTLSNEQNEKSKFMTTQRGFRMATSVGGSVTGEGGHYLIVDDPINPTQAQSTTTRKQVNQWFDQTFSTRLNHKSSGVIVVVMQRLHQDDLTGHLLKRGGWEHLCLPMVALKHAIYDFGAIYKERHVGELLHPARDGQGEIDRLRSDIGSTAFAAQFQQQPLPDDGGMVRPWWFGRYKEAPQHPEQIVQSWDTAIKTGKQHDASVCLTFAQKEGKSYLLDAKALRVEYPDLKKQLAMLADYWKPNAILIEDKASGQQLLQDAKRESTLPVIAIKPKQDKVTRFAAVSAMIEAGRVVLPEYAPWLNDFEEQLLAFPYGNHDDFVDSLTQYLDWLRLSNGGKAWIRGI